MDVYTHFQHTFMFKQLVNFASDDPFKHQETLKAMECVLSKDLKICNVI